MFKYCPHCGFKIEKQEKGGFLCPNCKMWTHYTSAPTVTVAVKVKDEGLIATRGKDPGKGMMDFVGGFLEYGEDPITGAVREFYEEASVKIDGSGLKFLGTWIDSYKYQGQELLLLNFAYILEVKEKFNVKASDDVAKLAWVPLDSMPNFAFPYLQKVWQKLKG